MKKFLTIYLLVLNILTLSAQENYVALAVKAFDLQKNQPLQAAQLFQKAYFLSKDQFLAQKAIENYLKINKLDEALQLAQNLTEPDRDLWMARIKAKQGKIDKALNLLAQYLKTNPNYSEYQVKNDSFFNALQNNELWLTFWQNHQDSLSERLDQLRLEVQLDQNIDVLSDLIKLEKQYPKSGRLHQILGDNFYKLHDYKNALKEYFAALNQSQNKFDLYVKIARTYHLLNNAQQALAFYRKAYNMRPYDLDLLIKIAKEQERLQNFSAARQTLKLYQKYRQNPDIQYYIAESYYLEKDYLNAILTLNQVLDHDQTHYKYFTLRGKSYLKTGNYKQAYKDLSMSLDLNPNQPELYNLIGEAAYFSGHKQEGCLYWQQSVETFHDPVSRKQLITFCGKK